MEEIFNKDGMFHAISDILDEYYSAGIYVTANEINDGTISRLNLARRPQSYSAMDLQIRTLTAVRSIWLIVY